ncbi:MAG: AarF/ABC1/UbiB kinase family protein [Acidimicrobiales bacterium]|nr:AarF/ABC1/UbiB kinase family protein [Acidimicrobiales bacterium]
MADDAEHTTTLADRAAASAWVAAEPGLAEAVDDLESPFGRTRFTLADEAVAAATPGVVAPDRLVRHAAAAGTSRVLRTFTRLGDLANLTPLRDPQGWAMEAAIEAFADQLALSGPASAEVARVIEGSGSLFPRVLVDELRSRHIRPLPVDADTVEWVAARSIGEVRLADTGPLLATPTSQLHAVDLADGRPANLRVRRPGIARQLRADARFSASLATALGRILPDSAGLGMGPIGFVELITRCGLEATDLRFEFLNLVELALVLEEGGHEAITVPHPTPAHLSERALVTERVLGVPLAQFGGDLADPAATVAALSAITLESALVHGVFWADPSPDHLLVAPGGRLVLAGVGACGHFTHNMRRAGIVFLRSVLGGDPAGQVEAMQIAGAAPAELDVDALIAELTASEALDVSRIMFGGEDGLLGALGETVRIMLTYDIKPPVEVALLLRTVFALGALVEQVHPDGGGLMAALMGLLPRLPDLLADATQAEADEA